jgi:hypothetical protein
MLSLVFRWQWPAISAAFDEFLSCPSLQIALESWLNCCAASARSNIVLASLMLRTTIIGKGSSHSA